MALRTPQGSAEVEVGPMVWQALASAIPIEDLIMRARVPSAVSILVCSALALGSLALLPSVVSAKKAEAGTHFYVSPEGENDEAGITASTAMLDIQDAIDAAQPGDTIHLDSGTYLQDIVTARDGKPGEPITITGPEDAVIKGGGNGRIVEINHSYITLDGFAIDGKFKSEDKSSSYRDKLIYAISKKAGVGVTGVKILDMDLRNAGGECVRFRYFAHDNEIAWNTITDCGVYDFEFSGGGKNGEGVYIGTAPEQWGTNGAPTDDADESDDNLVHDNIIKTNGNECVDIKEASSGNLVYGNDCSGQRDPDSAGLDARGNGNSFYGNTVYDNVGAGIRFGGDKSTDGIENDAYANTITDNERGGIKFMASPQGKICGNTMSGNGRGPQDDAFGTFGDKFDPTAPCSGGGTDTEPPSAPEALNAVAVDAESVRLTWEVSTDNQDVIRYEIYRNGASTSTGSSSSPAFLDSGLSPATTYTYTVKAVDAAGNKSSPSDEASARTLAGSDGGDLILEDFSSTLAADNFSVISGGRWRVDDTDEVYRLDRPGSKRTGNGNISVHATQVSGRFSLSTRARVKGTKMLTNDFSVIFGFRNLGDYCYASFNETNDDRTSGIFEVKNGQVTQVADIKTAIDHNSHGVGIDFDGSTAKVTLDGKEVATASVSACGTGQVGFGSRNDAAWFDDLIVKQDVPVTQFTVGSARR